VAVTVEESSQHRGQAWAERTVVHSLHLLQAAVRLLSAQTAVSLGAAAGAVPHRYVMI